MTCLAHSAAAATAAPRWSSPPGSHFLTVFATRRRPGLATTQFNAEFHAATHLLALEQRWHVRTAIVMPYHVHLLATIVRPAEAAGVMEDFKQRLLPCLQRSGLEWERGVHARPLSPGEDALPAFLYIFQNPYRTRLIRDDESWPGYYCAESDWTWFAALANTACHFPAWLPPVR
jgi:REP element-mobilizing transposase RayT